MEQGDRGFGIKDLGFGEDEFVGDTFRMTDIPSLPFRIVGRWSQPRHGTLRIISMIMSNQRTVEAVKWR